MRYRVRAPAVARRTDRQPNLRRGPGFEPQPRSETAGRGLSLAGEHPALPGGASVQRQADLMQSTPVLHPTNPGGRQRALLSMQQAYGNHFVQRVMDAAVIATRPPQPPANGARPETAAPEAGSTKEAMPAAPGPVGPVLMPPRPPGLPPPPPPRRPSLPPPAPEPAAPVPAASPGAAPAAPSAASPTLAPGAAPSGPPQTAPVTAPSVPAQAAPGSAGATGPQPADPVPAANGRMAGSGPATGAVALPVAAPAVSAAVPASAGAPGAGPTVAQSAVAQGAQEPAAETAAPEPAAPAEASPAGAAAPGAEATPAAAEAGAEPGAATQPTAAPPGVAGAGAAAEAAPAPAGPENDERFQGVVKRLEKAATKQKMHAPAAAKVAEAQAAVEPPENDRKSRAQAGQVDVMDAQEPKKPEPQSFLSLLRAELARITPKNMEETEDFKKEGKAGQLKATLTSNVSQQKDASAGDIKGATAAEPKPESVPAKPVTPMPDVPPDAPPPGVGAQDVLPQPKPAAEISMEEDTKTADKEMAENDIDEEQLQKANEPQFDDALKARQELQANTEKAPQTYREEEKAYLGEAKAAVKEDEKGARQGMRAQRAKGKGGVLTRQQEAKKKEEEERKKVADHIEGMYAQTKKNVEAKLSALDSEVSEIFDSGEKQARERFESYVDKRMSDYKWDRYLDRFGGSLLWAKDKLFGMPDEVNRFYEQGRDLYLKDMDAVLVKVAGTVETRLAEAKAEIARGKEEIRKYVEGLTGDLRKAGEQAEKKVADRFEELEQGVESKKQELAQKMAQRYKESRDKLDERIKELQAENKGLVDAFLDKLKAIIKALRDFKERVGGLLSQAGGVLRKIIKDPIGFLKNLLAAVKKGFNQFSDNILKHLKAGLVSWLFGTLAGAGIQIPTEFSLKAIFGLVMQVLGLTVDRIKAKVAKIIGPRNMELIEKAWEFVSVLISEGPAGLWEKIKEYLTNLKETVIGAIQDWVVTQIVKQAVIWVVSLFNPASALFKAIMAIVKVVMFFVERIDQILQLVETVVRSTAKIVAGDIGEAANWIENAMGKMVPILIGFLASLLGLGGISDKIKEIITKIQATVDKAVDKALNKIIGGLKGVFAKLGGLFGKGKAAVAGLISWWKTKQKFRGQDKQSHTIFFEGKGSQAELMVASAKQRVSTFLREKKQDADAADKPKCDSAIKTYNQVDAMKKDLANLQAKANKSDADQAKIKSKTAELARLFVTLGEQLSELQLGKRIDELVPTKVTFESGGGLPKSVTAHPLTEIPGNTTGTRPTPDDTVPKGWKHALILRKLGQPWVKGHMLSQKLHGPGDERNLIPIRGTDNSKMERAAESEAKQAAKTPGSIQWYRVKVSYHSGKAPIKYFPASITIEWGESKKAGSTEAPRFGKNPHPSSPVSITPSAPDVPEGAELPALDLNSVGRDQLLNAGLPMQLVLNLLEERKSGPFAAGDHAALRARMVAYYRKNLPNVNFNSVYWPLLKYRLEKSGKLVIK